MRLFITNMNAELAWRSGCVIECHATTRGSISGRDNEKTSFTSIARDNKWGRRLLRPVVSAVPLCPQTNFIVPLCPHADTTARLVRPVVSTVPLCPRWIFIVPLCPPFRYVRKQILSFHCVRMCIYIHICRNYFQLTLYELIIIK